MRDRSGRQWYAAAFPLAAVKGFRQRGHHVEIQRFSQGARFFGAIEDRHGAGAFRQNVQQVRGGEGPVEANFQHADFFSAAQQFINHFLTGADCGAHNHDNALGLRMSVELKRFVLTPGGGGKIVHRRFNVFVNRVVPWVSRFTRLEVGVRIS